MLLKLLFEVLLVWCDYRLFDLRRLFYTLIRIEVELEQHELCTITNRGNVASRVSSSLSLSFLFLYFSLSLDTCSSVSFRFVPLTLPLCVLSLSFSFVATGNLLDCFLFPSSSSYGVFFVFVFVLFTCLFVALKNNKSTGCHDSTFFLQLDVCVCVCVCACVMRFLPPVHSPYPRKQTNKHTHTTQPSTIPPTATPSALLLHAPTIN